MSLSALPPTTEVSLLDGHVENSSEDEMNCPEYKYGINTYGETFEMFKRRILALSSRRLERSRPGGFLNKSSILTLEDVVKRTRMFQGDLDLR